eukprot:316261_1
MERKISTSQWLSNSFSLLLTKYEKLHKKHNVVSNTPTNTTLFVVHGFIREIENAIKENIIIPSDIIEICYQFYSSSFKIFIHSTTINFELNSSHSTLCIANINRKSISNFVLPRQHKKMIDGIRTLCYIPYISSFINVPHIMNKHKCYDGLFTNNYGRCCLMLFESNKINHTNIRCNIVLKSSFKSNNLHDNNLEYCHSNHRLAFISSDSLCQLKLRTRTSKSQKLKISAVTLPDNN